jgi:hypothetical protein
MRTQVMTVTPDMAAKWLETNDANRRTRQKLVNRLADEIRHGRWMVTHQGISFDHTGKLTDGQHRLWAIVLAGIAVRVMVTNYERGEYNQDVADAIDGGSVRTPTDRLKEDPKLTAIYTALLRVGLHQTTVTAPYQLRAMHARFGSIGAMLLESYDHHTRMFSTSGYRAAAIMAVEAGDATEQYAFGLFKAMGGARLYELPKVAQSLHGQCVVRHRAKLRVYQEEDYVRGRFLFAESNRNKALRIMDSFRVHVIAQTKEIVSKTVDEYRLLH